MYVIQIDAPFETRKLEAHQLPLPIREPGPSSLVLRDRAGRWMVDPLLVLVSHHLALKKAKEDNKPIYELNGQVFAEIEWLVNYCRPHESLPEIIKATPGDVLIATYTGLAALMPAELVEVKMIRRVPDVFSEH